MNQFRVPRIVSFACLMAACMTQAQAQILISGYMANPPGGTDSPFEYVQLVAAADTDFSVAPHTVIWITARPATARGWVAGGAVTYAFSLSSGSVTAGQEFYVGGSGRRINGAGSADISPAAWIRTIDTGATPGDGSLGNASPEGVFGNGGDHADGIAVFNMAVGAITSNTVPQDALFFGRALGEAVVAGGTAGFQLPVNDRYSGGKLQATSFLFGDPDTRVFTRLAGTFDTTTDTWTVARVASFITNAPSLAAIASQIAISPLPSPGIVSPPALVNNQFNVGYTGVPGWTYTVQQTTNLSDAPWTFLTNLTAAPNGLFSLVVTNDPPAASRFFRLVRP